MKEFLFVLAWLVSLISEQSNYLVLLVNEATKNLIVSNISTLNFVRANYTIFELASSLVEETGRSKPQKQREREKETPEVTNWRR